MTQAARCQDTLERQDAVAKTRKKGWSKEIVMEEPDLLGEKDYIDVQSSTNHGTPWDTPIRRVVNCG